MQVTVDAQAFAAALKRLRPSRKYQSMQEGLITATAGGSALVLMGTLDNSASLDAVVAQAGSTPLPLEAALRLMASYPKRSQVVIRAEAGSVWFDKLKMPVTSPA